MALRGSRIQNFDKLGFLVQAPPVFGRSVNPISTRGDTFSPPITTSPPSGNSDLGTALLVASGGFLNQFSNK